MGHEIHTETGILVDTKNFSENGKVLCFLTANHGLLTTLATGVREQKSKMRGSIIPFSECIFDYVEGREVNRLTGINSKNIFLDFDQIVGEKYLIEKRKVISNIVNFLLRSVVGQEPNIELFENFKDGIERLGKVGKVEGELSGNEVAPLYIKISEENKDEFFQLFEIIFLLKILVPLGYWTKGEYDEFTNENYFSLREKKEEIVERINAAIKSTQL